MAEQPRQPSLESTSSRSEGEPVAQPLFRQPGVPHPDLPQPEHPHAEAFVNTAAAHVFPAKPTPESGAPRRGEEPGGKQLRSSDKKEISDHKQREEEPLVMGTPLDEMGPGQLGDSAEGNKTVAELPTVPEGQVAHGASTAFPSEQGAIPRDRQKEVGLLMNRGKDNKDGSVSCVQIQKFTESPRAKHGNHPHIT
jgi:hypothetical protein